MGRMEKLVGVNCVATLAIGLVIVQNVEARPQYAKALKAAYSNNEAVKKANCATCHPSEQEMGIRNNYGSAFGKLNREKNSKDKGKIHEALKKVEGEKSAVDGMTFGDLLKEGKLPGKN